MDVYGLQILDATLETGNTAEVEVLQQPELRGLGQLHGGLERRHGDGHPRLLSPHQRALGSAQGLPGPAGRGGSLAGLAGAEEAIRNMADARRRTIKAVYEDPRTGFGSIAQTLQQAQVRDPSISREEVKAFLDGLRLNQDRLQQLRARWTWPT